MNAARVIVLVIALAAGGIAAMLASRSDAPAPVAAPPVQAQIDTTEVLVAKDDIGIGQTLTEQNVGWQTWPADNIGSQFIQKKNNPNALKDLSGSIVRIAFASGEPIREAKVIKAGSAELHRRAVAGRHAGRRHGNLAGSRSGRIHPAERSRRYYPHAG